MTHVPSFADLYTTQFRFVWTMVRHLGVSPEEQDDVVQDIFVIIYERLPTLERPDALRSWIYGVLRRVVIAHHRTRRMELNKTGTLLIESEIAHSQPLTPQQLLEQSEQAALLWTLLAQLDLPRREVFVLAELQGMTAPEIATLLDVPLNTVYSRLRLARRELEQALLRFRARLARATPDMR